MTLVVVVDLLGDIWYGDSLTPSCNAVTAQVPNHYSRYSYDNIVLFYLQERFIILDMKGKTQLGCPGGKMIMTTGMH